MFPRLAKITAEKTLITTPIFYINADPHIGHLYTLYLSEYLKRVFKLHMDRTLAPIPSKEQRVFLTTGTDEHGEKVLRSAKKHGREIWQHVDSQAAVFKEMAEKFGIDIDRFIRTTEPDHKRLVNEIWDDLVSKQHIKREYYSGWYSIRDETFFNEKELKKNEAGNFVTEEGDPVEMVQEENYMLKSKDFVETIPNFVENTKVYPTKQKGRLSMASAERDISISRPKKRTSWGVELNCDESSVVYVWFDALINYLTLARQLNLFKGKSLDFSSPTTMINVVGKDIIKFHALMFPTILKMANVSNLDHMVVCHEHWIKDGRKMSKSYGNVVDPFALLQMPHAVEKLKLYFVSMGPYVHDADFSENQIQVLYSTFVDKIVNCYFRVFSQGFVKKTDFSEVTMADLEKDKAFFEAISQKYKVMLESVCLESSPEIVWLKILDYFDYLNQYITIQSPFNIKDPKQKGVVISRLVYGLALPIELVGLFVPTFYKQLQPIFGTFATQIQHNHEAHDSRQPNSPISSSSSENLGKTITEIINTGISRRDGLKREK